MTWQGNVEYFWYHKDMFEKAGITETPQTLEDLLDVCKKLKDAGMTPISAGNYDMIMRYPAFKAFRLEGNDSSMQEWEKKNLILRQVSQQPSIHRI